VDPFLAELHDLAMVLKILVEGTLEFIHSQIG